MASWQFWLGLVSGRKMLRPNGRRIGAVPAERKGGSCDENPMKESEKDYQLVVFDSGRQLRTISILEGSNLIGRWDQDDGAFPEIDLEGEDPDCKVSRKHAVIEFSSGRATVEDLGSLNGTIVNGAVKLEPGHPVELKPGDTISIGRVQLLFKPAR